MSGEKVALVMEVLDMDTGAHFSSVTRDLFSAARFRTVKNIGSGATGDVYQVESLVKPERTYAAKVFKFDDDDKKRSDKLWHRFKLEAGIMRNLNHPNIITCKSCHTCPSYGVIFMEYVPRGALYQYLDVLQDRHVFRFFRQIMSALLYMHGIRLVHRDVKLDNILVRDHDVCLIDFGLSEQIPEGTSLIQGYAGTLKYMAPEIRESTSSVLEYDGFKADAFATGVFLWSMLMKEEPTDTTQMQSVLFEKKEVNPFLKVCAINLLEKDPETRSDLLELFEEIQTALFSSNPHAIEFFSS